MLTREAFQLLYDQGPDAVYTLITAMEARITHLEERLAKDSHNSHKPPSSDGLAKKPSPSSLRTKTQRKPGGQQGHRGCTLLPVDCPDEIVRHVPEHCACCGASLKNAAVVDEQAHQVFDLPPLQLLVTEHRAQTRRCRCGTMTQALFPKEAQEGVQYGPRLKALCVYLRDYQLLPFARLKEMLSDLLDAPLSQGTLANALALCARTLKPVTEAIKKGVRRAGVAHFDETGMRVGGRLHWLHSASTAKLTHYFCHAKRGKAGADAAGVLPGFLGCAVHDGFSSYAGYACRHSLCNAHHLRELTRLEEAGQAWAAPMKRLLLQMKAGVERAKERGRRQVPLLWEWRFLARYGTLLTQGYAANPPPAKAPSDTRGRPKQTPARNLLRRLDRHRGWVLAFLFDFSVPFDNNLAERDLRMMKVRQKISGGFRTKEGADDFCVVRGYISTLRKQKMPVLSALEQTFRGNPVYPCIAAG